MAYFAIGRRHSGVGPFDADRIANGLGHTSLLDNLALAIDAAVAPIARHARCQARPLVDAANHVLALAASEGGDALPGVRGRRRQDALALTIVASLTVGRPIFARPVATSDTVFATPGNGRSRSWSRS